MSIETFLVQTDWGLTMLIGYARVSTIDQNLDLQMDALQKAECDQIHSDVASGSKSSREGLDEALKFLRKHDTLVVWKLDRLGRSISDLIKIVADLNERDIGFRSLQEKIDTTTTGGKLIFHVFAALAEFERDIIRERTNAGLAAARSRGKRGGRPKAMNAKKIKLAKTLLAGDTNIDEVCQTLSVSRATLYRYVPRHRHAS